jgi:hypothetical protein
VFQTKKTTASGKINVKTIIGRSVSVPKFLDFSAKLAFGPLFDWGCVMKKRVKSRSFVERDAIPEPYMIEELQREQENGRYPRLPLIMPEAQPSIESLPYWPKPKEKPAEGVIIIQL